MPILIPTNKFLEDLEAFRRQAALRKKIAKTLNFLEINPLHPGLHLERIVNDPSAWSIRVDRSYRIAVDPTSHLEGGAIRIGPPASFCFASFPTTTCIGIRVDPSCLFFTGPGFEACSYMFAYTGKPLERAISKVSEEEARASRLSSL